MNAAEAATTTASR